MKKHLTKLFSLLLASMFILSIIPHGAAAAAEDCAFYILPEDNEGLIFSVGSYEKSSRESYMFLPNTVDATSVNVRYSGTLSSVSGDAVTNWNQTDGIITVDTTVATQITAGTRRLIFMQSSLPSMSIVLNEGESIDTINADKEARIGAKVAIDGAENSKYNLAFTNIEMKTRGNTTFWPDKKPYQIKFDKKTDLFGMGKAKKWILLANYYDGTSIRSKVFFDLADELGMDYECKSVFVDLYIDGDYRGVYQLTEKIEIGSARVDLNDEYGVILEMESNQRTDVVNDIFFTTNYFTKDILYKDYVYDFEDTSTPERLQKVNEIRDFVEDYINGFEEAMCADEPDWETISSMIDVDSFIYYYFLNEYGEQVDCTLASTYFYIDGPGDVLHCGPVWDFDRICAFNDSVPKNTDYVKNITDNTDKYRCEWYKELFRNPEFVKRANELYETKIKAAFDTEKINNTIDELQAELMPSLLMNHVKWVVFYNRSYTADELVSTGTVDRIAYTTNSVKGILADKKAYMDKAYAGTLPAISYNTYTTAGKATKAYTGGCMTYSSPLAGLKVELIDSIYDGQIIYRLNCNGTLTDVSAGGEINKMSSGFQRANGVYIKLEGNIANYCSVQYRVHISGRWSNWVSDGNFCGRSTSNNGAYYIDRIQVRLLKKADTEYTDVNYVSDGVTTVESEVVGNVIGTEFVPEKEGYVFNGWYTDEGLTTLYGGDDVAESGVVQTYYAGFDKLPGKPGDVTGDGKINSRDLSLLKQYLTGNADISAIDFNNTDINSDGKINSKDLAMLKRLLSEGL